MKSSTVTRRKVLMILAIVSSIIYIGWRTFFTIPLEYGLVSLIAGLALLIAEATGMLEGYSHYRNMSSIQVPDKPDVPLHLYPDVDVLITTHMESTELLYKTINGCLHMKYPDKEKVHIYVCDDKNRQEMKDLAFQMGVSYFGMTENKHAKAGNQNNALKQTKSPLVVSLDADMIPTQNFLLETVPYFFLPKMINENNIWRMRTETEIDKNFKVGFIQTPQSFYNADMFQFNLFAEKNIPNEQDFFFREVNVGRNRSNSPIFAGSNTVISRQALEDVGGIVEGTITEDFATGIKIQAEGYTCYALPHALVHGLAPIDIKSLIKQRQRWGRGSIQTLRSFSFLFGKLPLKAKLSYLSCFVYWWTFFRRFVYIAAPILFILFGVVVVDTTLWQLLLIWLPSYIIYNLALKVLSGNVRNQVWSNIVDTILFPHMVIPVMLETFGIRLRSFIVTSKTRVTEKNTEFIYAVPHLLLFAVSLVGLYRGVGDMISNNYYGQIIVIYWLVVNSYFLLMAIVFMLGRNNFRNSERFYTSVEVSMVTKNGELRGLTSDLSETGLAVLLYHPAFIDDNEETVLRLTHFDYDATIEARLVHVTQTGDKWKYSFEITKATEENKRKYYQIVYDRDHTLPNTINSGVMEDIVGVAANIGKTKKSSNRKLPRIPMDIEVRDTAGNLYRVINYNYKYIVLSGHEEKDNLQLAFSSNLLLDCILLPGKSTNDSLLYHIKNWKEIYENDDLRKELHHLLNIPDHHSGHADQKALDA